MNKCDFCEYVYAREVSTGQNEYEVFRDGCRSAMCAKALKLMMQYAQLSQPGQNKKVTINKTIRKK